MKRPDRPLRFGLVGHPVSQSLSPVLHDAALRAAGLEGTYELLDTPIDGLDPRVDALREGRWDGLNVTTPLKEEAVALCDLLDDEDVAPLAVNVLWSENGVIVGSNTDVPGLRRALDRLFPDAPWREGRVAVLGAGGAAAAAVFAASASGARQIALWNRTPIRAATLARECSDHVDARVLVAGTPEEACTGASLVLQATTLGMGTEPGDAAWTRIRDRARSPLARVRDGACLYDLVYRPTPTPWVAAARERALRAEGGLEMLVQQAALAFEAWTGLPAPVDVMRTAGLRASGVSAPVT